MSSCLIQIVVEIVFDLYLVGFHVQRSIVHVLVVLDILVQVDVVVQVVLDVLVVLVDVHE
ncbi:hypothetical protein A2U01_0069992 [Trifolium medium]|uniref:Uncharacterized protein n=1 Tax=Trifolium medium TaxID=97028 RepID=A0A392SJC6_9FABA|nr:hypothetical protein [Trifolium medium]